MKKYGLIIWSFVCAAVILLFTTRSSVLFLCNNWDDANSYFSMGKGMMNGLVIYRDLYDQKGPYLYLLYGIAYLISHKTFFGVFLLVWLPLCQRGWIGHRLDILAVVMQSVVFSQFIYIIGFACYKSVREAMLGIVMSLAWMAFYLFLYKIFGIVWRIDSYDFIFYCCLIVPFMPIFVYIIRLLLLIPERRKKANIIKTETAALKQMLDDRITE